MCVCMCVCVNTPVWWMCPFLASSGPLSHCYATAASPERCGEWTPVWARASLSECVNTSVCVNSAHVAGVHQPVRTMLPWRELADTKSVNSSNDNIKQSTFQHPQAKQQTANISNLTLMLAVSCNAYRIGVVVFETRQGRLSLSVDGRLASRCEKNPGDTLKPTFPPWPPGGALPPVSALSWELSPNAISIFLLYFFTD